MPSAVILGGLFFFVSMEASRTRLLNTEQKVSRDEMGSYRCDLLLDEESIIEENLDTASAAGEEISDAESIGAHLRECQGFC